MCNAMTDVCLLAAIKLGLGYPDFVPRPSANRKLISASYAEQEVVFRIAIPEEE